MLKVLKVMFGCSQVPTEGGECSGAPTSGRDQHRVRQAAREDPPPRPQQWEVREAAKD